MAEAREVAQRQHRIVALLAVVQCWLRNLDGVVLERHVLERLLGLRSFRESRVAWLQEDLQEFFPYQKVFSSRQGETRSFSSIFVSRKETAKPTDPNVREFKLPRSNTPTCSFDLLVGPKGTVNFDEERTVTAFLLLLSQGYVSPIVFTPLVFDFKDQREIWAWARATPEEDLPSALQVGDSSERSELTANFRLPEELDDLLSPFPAELLNRIAPAPTGCEYAFADGKAVILHRENRRMFDVFDVV